jgi:hypothetical protein
MQDYSVNTMNFNHSEQCIIVCLCVRVKMVWPTIKVLSVPLEQGQYKTLGVRTLLHRKPPPS